jgi:ribonuclease-3
VLRDALAHRSWVAEHTGSQSNERLEFLGDAVLGWLVAELAFTRYPDLGEGRLTDIRKGLVNTTALAEVASSVDLGGEILLGRGEAAAGGRAKPSILADAFEAVLAAVYLDGGPDAARGVVARLVGPRMDHLVHRLDGLDHKTHLQERAARLGLGAPRYRVVEEGPDHAKVFHAEVLLADEVRGHGSGRTKKQAEQVAAAMACGRLPVGS